MRTIGSVEAPGPPPPSQPSSSRAPGGEVPDNPPPGVPTGGVIVVAFIGVVVAGLLGALAAYGIVDVDCRGGCETNAALAAVVGALIGTIGGGVVAVLVLRARAMWRVPHDDAPDLEQ